MDGEIFQPAMLVSWMVKMLKTWHEARRICGEWSCFHVFSCVHFHFRCIQIGFISRIYLTILDASTLAALCFNKPRGRFLPPLSRADLGGFPMSCASRKTPSSTATTTWLQFPIPKKRSRFCCPKCFQSSRVFRSYLFSISPLVLVCLNATLHLQSWV